HLNESFYTNVAWQYEQPALPGPESRPENQMLVTRFPVQLTGKPYVVTSHVDKSSEVLLQDSLNQIHLVSATGKVLWSMSLNGPIVREVFQVDYYKNGKLQYFFVAGDKLHIIDRLGNYVPPFPVEMKTKEVDYVSLVDYDQSKIYRLLITDRSGRIWIYEKQGVHLEGWKPNYVEGALASPARHHRIRGREYLIAIRRDGRVYLMNRRGELQKGFPINLDARPTGEYFLELGSRVDNSNFVVVSSDGFRIKFNTEGKIQTRETLVKSSVNSKFSLVKEYNGKSYCMVRQDPGGLVVQDAIGKEIISNSYIGMNPVVVSYYDFGAGSVYYSITDRVQNLTYVYDQSGNLLTSPPLESAFCDLQPRKSGNVAAYLTYQSALTVKPLP